MLPTVPEEPEDFATTPELLPTHSAASTPFQQPLGITGYPLDISYILQRFTDTSYVSKPIVIITPGHPDVEVKSIAELLAMAEVTAAAAAAAASEGVPEDAAPLSPAAPSSPSGIIEGGKKGGEALDSSLKAEEAGEEGTRKDSTSSRKKENHENGESSSRGRKDSESGRSGGEERERRGSGGRRNRNYRGNNGRRQQQQDKKWWVCPDPACRTRNYVDSVTCVNCRLAQDRKSGSSGTGGGRFPYARKWDKSSVSGLVCTHVTSPTTLYLQTPQQQADYARLRNCMAQSYANACYVPSLVAAKMLLGVKVGDGYERVRTEERREVEEGAGAEAADGDKEPSSSPKVSSPPSSPTVNAPGSPSKSPPGSPATPVVEWRVQLVDRGSWCWVREGALQFLLAGMADLAPLASKYTLNELRLKRDATEQQVEESRVWLEEQLKDAKVDGDVYRQMKENSPMLYVDLYLGETLLNRAICEHGSVEPKMNLKWLKSGSRVSTSSMEEGGAPASPPRDHGDEPRKEEDASDADHRSSSVNRDGEPKQQRKRGRRAVGGSDARDGGGAGAEGDSGSAANRDDARPAARGEERSGGGRRSGNWWGRRSRDGRGGGGQQRSLPPLHDWAVLCFDQRTAYSGLRALCELVERVGKDSRVSVSPADSIRQEKCEDESAMLSVLAEVIATHPRLLLLLCVLPHHVQDYGGLERTGRSLGVCVVCVRGDSLADTTPTTATKLLKDLQTALLHSPAILPPQGYNQSANGGPANSNNRRRRDRKSKRSQNNRRTSASDGRSRSPASPSKTSSLLEGLGGSSDPRLQAVVGAASQGIALLQKLALQPGGQLAESSLSPGMKALLQSPTAHQDIAKALESLEYLQVSYNQARSYTHEAFQAAGSFFSHLSTAITPALAGE